MQTYSQRVGWANKGVAKPMNSVQQIEQLSTRAADAGAGIAAGAAGTAWLIELNTWVQIGAGMAAIIAGIAAAAFHVYKIRELRRLRKSEHEASGK
jgi:hypothetical protein